VPNIRNTASQTGWGAAAAAAITALCFPLHLDFPIVGCLFLLLVVILSAFSTFASSAIVSVVAIACLDYFFVPPILNLRISRPLDGLALLTFLVTALVITRLASRAREEARNAEARRSDLARLYDLASCLVSVGPDVAVKRGYLGIFRGIFHLRAVCLFDGAAASASFEGESQHNLRELTKQAYIADRDYDRAEARIAIRCMRTAGKAIGAVGFEGLEDAASMAGPLSMLAAAMVQRALSFQQASEAAAATQVEVLRSAILDAFAHQFKTPLAAILTAAGSLRETGPLVPEQTEMVETIETQAAGLGQLTTRLLRMARLDRDEIKPRLQLTDLAAVIRRVANQYKAHANGHNLVVRLDEGPVDVLCDPDMLGLAVVQLLDNAFRYSPPATTITATVAFEDRFATIRVANQGPPILPEEQGHIFDRFYRGVAAHQISGTGLGLYVARKIVVAHGGTLELDAERKYGPDTTFCLRLPVAKDEARHELKAS
jgi:two-component system sensor histidine kinase KdpD